jgi:hypothetical protein
VYRPQLIIRVPRIEGRHTLEACRYLALETARRHGIRSAPDFRLYDGLPAARGGPLSEPQGYDFSWELPAYDVGEPKLRAHTR